MAGKEVKIIIKIRKTLSGDGLFKRVRTVLGQAEDHRTGDVKISLTDVLMSGFALFSLKSPSLLDFNDEHRQKPEKLKGIYGIENVPSDTRMREILDERSGADIRPAFKALVQEAQRGKVLERMKVGKYHILSGDGTGYFSSQTIHCASCLERTHRKTGDVTYSHQFYGGALVHPDKKEVIPLYPEPIRKQDGEKKNDCERNASKRFFRHVREDFPRLPLLVVEDGLGSNAPHIRLLMELDMRYVLGAKPGDHAYLFKQIEKAVEAGTATDVTVKEDGMTRRYRFVNQLQLNASNPDVIVNVLEFWETKNGKTRYFSWVTDIQISQLNMKSLMRIGRSRWKIENETFNTLKNQGYHFEHNFGHGKNNLSVVFATLMMLAFSVDQIQQAACPLFQAAWRECKSKRVLWQKMRAYFFSLPFYTMTEILRAIVHGYTIEGRVVINDTS